MSHLFAIAVPGAPGHLTPTIPVALELRRRGHQVHFVGDRGLPEQLAGLDFTVHAFGPELHHREIVRYFPEFIRLRGLRQTNYMFDKIILPLIPPMVEETSGLLESLRPDVLLVDFIAYAGPILAERHRIPWATSGLFPHMLPGRTCTPPSPFGLGPARGRWGRLRNRILWALTRLYVGRFDRQINDYRRASGLLPTAKEAFLNSTTSPYLYIGFSAPEIEWRAAEPSNGGAGFPPQVHLVGPCLYDGVAETDPPEWISRLREQGDSAQRRGSDGGRPLVYVTQGTSVSQLRPSFFSMVVEALGEMEVEVVMTVSQSVDPSSLAPLPANFRVERFVPHHLILPSASLMVHHSGINTCMGGMVHGVPMVIAPYNWDQPDNARRCQEAGVGVIIRPWRLNARRLRRAVEEVLGDAAYRERATRLASRLARYDAPRTAADLLEELARTGKPVLRA